MLFDYLTAARRAPIPEDKLGEVCSMMRAEFPSDEVMAGLGNQVDHLLPGFELSSHD